MPKFVCDEECVLCLGTGWQTEAPIVLGQNEDGTDILSEPKISMCRCALVDNHDADDEDEDYDDENEDAEDDERIIPPFSGTALVPVR